MRAKPDERRSQHDVGHPGLWRVRERPPLKTDALREPDPSVRRPNRKGWR